VQTKPHGHGDVHMLLHTSGAVQGRAGQGRAGQGSRAGQGQRAASLLLPACAMRRRCTMRGGERVLQLPAYGAQLQPLLPPASLCRAVLPHRYIQHSGFHACTPPHSRLQAWRTSGRGKGSSGCVSFRTPTRWSSAPSLQRSVRPASPHSAWVAVWVAACIEANQHAAHACQTGSSSVAPAWLPSARTATSLHSHSNAWRPCSSCPPHHHPRPLQVCLWLTTTTSTRWRCPGRPRNP
jgi:hypothetical protein